MEPEEFEHISAVLALYRPGPMGANSHTNYALRKNGKQEIEPIHPELEEPLKDILDTTYGLIVYQEQVMAIAQKVANYTLGEADLLRRAMGKKKKAELDKQYATFHDGMISNGYSEGAIKALWDILLPFSDYAFNKAHTAAYGLVSYWTAYLKAHYPQEYIALLTSVGDNKDKLALYLNECRAMGITVLAPDVNESTLTFAPVGDDIRFGMGAIRNVGANVVEGMIAARDEKGRYESFNDFLKKVPLQVCNKRTIESLIKAGAFDDLGHTRRSLSLIHEAAVDAAVAVKRKEAAGQFDLFGSFGMDDALGDELTVTIPDVPDWERREKLNFERDMLGLYVSDHRCAAWSVRFRTPQAIRCTTLSVKTRTCATAKPSPLRACSPAFRAVSPSPAVTSTPPWSWKTLGRNHYGHVLLPCLRDDGRRPGGRPHLLDSWPRAAPRRR